MSLCISIAKYSKKCYNKKMNQRENSAYNIDFNIEGSRPFFSKRISESMGAKALKSVVLLASIYLTGTSSQVSRPSFDAQNLVAEYNLYNEIGSRAMSIVASEHASSLPTLPTLAPEIESTAEESKTPNRYKIASASLSEYKLNEDACVVTENSAVICDGVGSAKNGLLASRLASDHISSELSRIPDVVEDSTTAEYIMAGLLLSTNRYIKEQQKSLGNNMASTASVAKIVQRRVGDRLRTYALVGNVGDSPIYVMRDGKVIEITNYHNRRKLPASKKRPALGKQIETIPHVYWVRLKKGDQLCLTSNGVSKSDPDKKNLTKVAKKSGTPQQTANRVVSFSNKKLSKDARSIAVLSA